MFNAVANDDLHTRLLDNTTGDSGSDAVGDDADYKTIDPSSNTTGTHAALPVQAITDNFANINRQYSGCNAICKNMSMGLRNIYHWFPSASTMNGAVRNTWVAMWHDARDGVVPHSKAVSRRAKKLSSVYSDYELKEHTPASIERRRKELAAINVEVRNLLTAQRILASNYVPLDIKNVPPLPQLLRSATAVELTPSSSWAGAFPVSPSRNQHDNPDNPLIVQYQDETLEEQEATRLSAIITTQTKSVEGQRGNALWREDLHNWEAKINSKKAQIKQLRQEYLAAVDKEKDLRQEEEWEEGDDDNKSQTNYFPHRGLSTKFPSVLFGGGLALATTPITFGIVHGITWCINYFAGSTLIGAISSASYSAGTCFVAGTASVILPFVAAPVILAGIVATCVGLDCISEGFLEGYLNYNYSRHSWKRSLFGNMAVWGLLGAAIGLLVPVPAGTFVGAAIGLAIGAACGGIISTVGLKQLFYYPFEGFVKGFMLDFYAGFRGDDPNNPEYSLKSWQERWQYISDYMKKKPLGGVFMAMGWAVGWLTGHIFGFCRSMVEDAHLWFFAGISPSFPLNHSISNFELLKQRLTAYKQQGQYGRLIATALFAGITWITFRAGLDILWGIAGGLIRGFLAGWDPKKYYAGYKENLANHKKNGRGFARLFSGLVGLGAGLTGQVAGLFKGLFWEWKSNMRAALFPAEDSYAQTYKLITCDFPTYKARKLAELNDAQVVPSDRALLRQYFEEHGGIAVLFVADDKHQIYARKDGHGKITELDAQYALTPETDEPTHIQCNQNKNQELYAAIRAKAAIAINNPDTMLSGYFSMPNIARWFFTCWQHVKEGRVGAAVGSLIGFGIPFIACRLGFDMLLGSADGLIRGFLTGWDPKKYSPAYKQNLENHLKNYRGFAWLFSNIFVVPGHIIGQIGGFFKGFFGELKLNLRAGLSPQQDDYYQANQSQQIEDGATASYFQATNLQRWTLNFTEHLRNYRIGAAIGSICGLVCAFVASRGLIDFGLGLKDMVVTGIAAGWDPKKNVDAWLQKLTEHKENFRLVAWVITAVGGVVCIGAGQFAAFLQGFFFEPRSLAMCLSPYGDFQIGEGATVPATPWGNVTRWWANICKDASWENKRWGAAAGSFLGAICFYLPVTMGLIAPLWGILDGAVQGFMTGFDPRSQYCDVSQERFWLFHHPDEGNSGAKTTGSNFSLWLRNIGNHATSIVRIPAAISSLIVGTVSFLVAQACGFFWGAIADWDVNISFGLSIRSNWSFLKKSYTNAEDPLLNAAIDQTLNQMPCSSNPFKWFSNLWDHLSHFRLGAFAGSLVIGLTAFALTQTVLGGMWGLYDAIYKGFFAGLSLCDTSLSTDLRKFWAFHPDEDPHRKTKTANWQLLISNICNHFSNGRIVAGFTTLLIAPIAIVVGMFVGSIRILKNDFGMLCNMLLAPTRAAWGNKVKQDRNQGSVGDAWGLLAAGSTLYIVGQIGGLIVGTLQGALYLPYRFVKALFSQGSKCCCVPQARAEGAADPSWWDAIENISRAHRQQGRWAAYITTKFFGFISVFVLPLVLVYPLRWICDAGKFVGRLLGAIRDGIAALRTKDDDHVSWRRNVREVTRSLPVPIVGIFAHATIDPYQLTADENGVGRATMPMRTKLATQYGEASAEVRQFNQVEQTVREMLAATAQGKSLGVDGAIVGEVSKEYRFQQSVLVGMRSADHIYVDALYKKLIEGQIEFQNSDGNVKQPTVAPTSSTYNRSSWFSADMESTFISPVSNPGRQLQIGDNLLVHYDPGKQKIVIQERPIPVVIAVPLASTSTTTDHTTAVMPT